MNRQGRKYTEHLLSATMEGIRFARHPAVLLGGGASVVSRHLSPKDGLCKTIFLLDDKVNAVGFERVGRRVAPQKRGMKRPQYVFRPNLNEPQHCRAWALLQQMPPAKRKEFLQSILAAEQTNRLEKASARWCGGVAGSQHNDFCSKPSCQRMLYQTLRSIS